MNKIRSNPKKVKLEKNLSPTTTDRKPKEEITERNKHAKYVKNLNKVFFDVKSLPHSN